jgi:hypothetical protein
MSETITLQALDLSGETLTMFLRKSDGSLLNTGGDAMTEAGTTGVFTATLAESRTGLGPLAVRICAGGETANNLLYDGFLVEGTTVIDSAIRAELDSAVAAQITAIETFATRVTTGIVQDGAVWQFTANMLELAPSGSSVVTVLPATGIVANRSAGVTLLPVIGETISQAITVYQSDGTTAVNLSGKTLKIIFETMSGVDVAVVQAADITIGGTGSNVVTFAYPSTVTASERTLRFAIRDAAAPLTMYLQGVCSVIAAPKVDA